MINAYADNRKIIHLLRADLLRNYLLIHNVDCSVPRGIKLWIGIASPRFIPVLLCRIAYSLHSNKLDPLAKIIALLNFFVFGIEISVRCPIGPGLFLPHTQGTVIGALRIGSNATIFQGVTLGASNLDFEYTEKTRPQLGDNVMIGAGAKVLGGLTLGDNVRVGANSVVLNDIPSGCLAVGAPARIVHS